MAVRMNSPREEHKQGGMFQRARTMFARRSLDDSSHKPSSLADSLEKVTQVCIETLKAQENVCDQHVTIGKWAADCCVTLKYTLLGIRNPNSPENQALLDNFRQLARHSSYARSIIEKIDDSPSRPLPDFIYLDDASHYGCNMCTRAQKIRDQVQEKYFEKFFPGKPCVGLIGIPLVSKKST